MLWWYDHKIKENFIACKCFQNGWCYKKTDIQQ